MASAAIPSAPFAATVASTATAIAPSSATAAVSAIPSTAAIAAAPSVSAAILLRLALRDNWDDDSHFVVELAYRQLCLRKDAVKVGNPVV
jgi:hypothetical protein